MNGRFMREMPLDEYTQTAGRNSSAVSPTRSCVAACAAVQEKAQTLAEVWPLIRFAFEPPVDDPKAWKKVMKPGTGETLRAARDAIAAAEPFDPEGLEAALGPIPEQLGLGAGRSTSRSASRSPDRRSRPGSSSPLALLGREEALARIDAALGSPRRRLRPLSISRAVPGGASGPPTRFRPEIGRKQPKNGRKG